jgi:predicted permease
MPGLTAVVVVSLGIGIGVNTAVFSWIQARVLQPLPGVAGAAGFLLVEPRAQTGSYPGVSWLEYQDLQRRLGSIRELIAARMVPFNVGPAGRPERTFGMLVSGNYFSALGLKPALGRFLRPEEVERAGGDPVAVISHAFWQTRLAGAPGVIGETVRVNDTPLTIVGIAPAGFQGTVIGMSFDLWVPATLAPALIPGSGELELRSSRGYTATGILRPGATRAQAQVELNRAMEELARDYQQTNATIKGEILRFWQAPRGPQRFIVSALVGLQGVLLLLMVVVCGNTANLMLARASAREREMGVRMALGAGAARIASLVLMENLLLGLMGAGLGAAIAVWATKALRAVPIFFAFPVTLGSRIDPLSLAFAAIVGIGCGLTFGIPPVLQLARAHPHRSIRSGFHTARRSKLRDVLIAVEVALALVVLVVAGYFMKSFGETRDTDPGFRREGVLLAAYDLSGRAASPAASSRFSSELLERLRARPGVESAAIAVSVPLDIHGLPIRTFTLDGRARADGNLDEALANTVTPGYFDTMGIAILAGADFVRLTDTAMDPQAIVNEEFVRRYLQGAAPAAAVGRGLASGGRRYTIAGIVKNSLYEAFGEPLTPIIYFSYRDRPASRGEIHIRPKSESVTGLAADVRAIVAELDAGLPVYNVRTITDHIETNLILRRIPARMFAVLGPLLLLLAAIGIYSVVSYSVAHRTTEIGIRLALGATARRVVGEFVRQSLIVIGLGALAGWLVAIIVAAAGVVPGSSIDLSIFLGVPATMLSVATVASWLPARRASKVDPIAALRAD